MADLPIRVKLSRAKGWRMPENTVKVDRSTPWGNPYQAGKDGDGSPKYLVGLFADYLNRPEQAEKVQRIKRELCGKNLACWCSLDAPCHADVLLEMANGECK